MTYGYYSNKRGRKQSRSKTKQLELRRILASLTMAAGIFAAPFGGVEAAIVGKEGVTGPSISQNGNVYTVRPENVSGEFAYSRFKEFGLTDGQIANLFFNKENGASASVLANLVNSKIDINGIVNGIKDGKIDGHLIFLSPQGIAVGSSGVINAGQFTGIVPAQTNFDKLYNSANPATEITLTAINKIKDDGTYAYPQGENGKIDISGKINTHSGVMLGAGIININDGARIQSTKDLDFTNLVNIGGDSPVSAGLTLTAATDTTGGDIILGAKQVSDVKDTKTENNAQTANPIRWSERSTDLSAAVNIGKNEIGTNETPKGVSISSSDGAVRLTAESTSTYEDSTPMTLTNTLRDIVLGEQTGEKTIVDGLIDKLAGKESTANKYLFVNYSSKKNKSAVNIGQNSTITGNNIEVAATSTVNIKQSITGLTGEGKKDSNGNTVPSGSAAVAAVAISRVYNNADIVIDGNLTANGADSEGNGIRIAANAGTTVELSSTGNGGANNKTAIGVAVLTGDTKAKVTVNAGATNLTANNGKASVEAVTGSDIDINVGAVGPQSYVVSNVGVANYDTSADVILNRSINAGAVDIKAENVISKLKMTVDNTVKDESPNGKDTAVASTAQQTEDNNAATAEKNKPDSEKSQDEIQSEQRSIDPTRVIRDASVDTTNTQDTQTQDAAGAIQKVQDRVAGTNVSGTNSSNNGSGNNSQPTSAFGLGTSVGVFSNKNDANVTIGKNVVITATKTENAQTPDGSVNISAKTLMKATAQHEDTLQFKVKNTLANANVEIGAAVLVSNVKNNATVLLENEGNNANAARITGAGAVSIGAEAGMGKYNKPAANNQTEETTSILTYTVSAEGTSEEANSSTFALSGSVGVNTLKNNAIVLLGQNSQVAGSALTLSSDATTGAEGTYGAEETNPKVGIGASVGIQNIRGNSLVMAGKGVQLTGSESLAVSANNEMDVKNNVQKAGKGNSVGVSGMVALSYGGSNSIVSLDDEVNITTGFATITSTNSTNVDNSARTEMNGNEGVKAFGIGAGIVNYDVNSIAMVADNGSDISAPSEGTTDEAKAAQKIYKDATLARSVAGSSLAGKLGAATTSGTKGSITTGGLIGAAVTTGMIQNDAKANANVAPKEEGSGSEGNANENQADNWTQWTNQGREGANEARTTTNNLEQDTVTSQNESGAPNASGAAGEASRAANPDATSSSDPTDITPANAGASIGIEGSAALTFLGGRTDAILDNVTVKSGTEAEPAPVAAVSLSATDFLGSITIGGTGVKNKLEEGSSSTTVGIGGTFAMNSSKRDVDSLIRNAVLPMALMVSNSATKIGIEVAAGMGASSSNSGGTSVAGAGVVYYNKAKQDVHALLINNNVMGASVSNSATSTDFQIAGGLSGNAAKVGVGGAVAISNLENNLSSGIIGGNYTVLSSVDVEAQKGTTQINGALAGTKGSYGFEGAFAYGSVKNTTRAYISSSETSPKAIIMGLEGSAVNVKAGEIPVIKTDAQLTNEKTKTDSKIDSSIDSNPNTIDTDTTHNYIQLDDTTKTNAKTQLKNQANAALDKEKETQTANKTTLEGKGIDTTGASYLDNTKDPSDSTNNRQASSSLDTDSTTDAGAAAGEAAGDENEAKDELGKNRSITITAAMGGGWNGEAGAGAGIAYNYVKNDIAADIKDSNITAGTVNGEAATDSLIVSVGAGVAVGGKAFNGAGSGSWNDLKNDTRVTFENNDITGKNICEQAHNTSSIINIAGEVAGGKGMALGLSLAYNSLNNTTGTYLKGNTVTLQDENKATAIRLATMNQSKALAVAGGVDVNISQELLGAVGTVAINRGVNNTESVIDGKTTGNTVTNTTLNNVKDLSVKATDVTKKTTVAGGVSVGGKKVGVGGAVAYTSIGSSSKKEKLLAEINHADITTIGAGTIEVSAADSLKNANNELVKSRITSVGAGVGVSWGKNWFNLQGAAAVSDIYKTNRASLNNTNITASIDSNTNNATNQPAAVTVTADTKSKINSVGAVANISVKSVVTAAVGIAINRMNQDTVAEMNTDDGNTTMSNVGLTQVRATGDADIHSVGVGTTVSVLERAAAAGSGSYNYIGNNVDAIIKNQNLTSNSSVGVVARSDDRLYNFAGGFSIGAATNVALGTAVSTNKISGNTNALVSGGSLAAADTGAITVTRPQDTNLFTINNIDLTTDRERLSANRQESTKTGIVVDSSATHTLISQLSSGGVGANSSFAVNLDGTVNINTIEGKTTAKIQDANLNSEGKASNINVNAVDYTNIGSFTGTPAIAAAAAAGVSIGVSANWETFDRKTEAEISSSSVNAKKNVYAKNLTVDAIAKHGSSSLAFAASAGGGKVGITSGDGIMRHKNSSTTSAQLKNVNAVFDGTAEIKAEHLGNSFSQNIAAGLAAGMVAVAAGAGVSVMDDTSTVTAEVTDSVLKETAKATSDTDKKTISVLAKNENHWKNTLVTANLAVGIGAGLAANVGIHNTTGQTAAVVSNSHLEVTDVTVKATDKLTAHATGGVGAGGIGGVGVAVTLNNINSSVSAHVNGGSVKASNNIEVTAEAERDFDSQVTGAAAGGIGVGVNVAVTSINKGITDAQLSNAKDENGNPMGSKDGKNVDATTKENINKHLNSVNGAKGALGLSQATFYGLNADGKADLNAANNANISLSTPTYSAETPDTKKLGVHTKISGGASLTAEGNVNVTAKDTSDIHEKNVGVTAAGAASVNVTDAIIHTNYDTDVTLNSATVTGKNVNINALQTQKANGGKGSEVKVTAVTVGALGGVGVGYAGIVNRGSTDINITGSTIKATGNDTTDKGVTINATDESKHRSDILSVGVAALNVTTTFASVENYSNVGITLNDTTDSENNIISTNISSAKDVTIDAKKANALEAHTQGVGVGGVNVAVNHATIEDGGKDKNGNIVKGIAAAKITGTNGTFSANSFHLGATNDTTAKLSAGNVAVSVLGVSTMRGKGVMDMGAEVDVAGGSFNAKTVEFASQLGTANGRTLEGNVKGHNISVGAVAPDTVRLETTATGKVNVANSTFGENTSLILDNESYVDRKAYIYDVTVGGVAVGNSRAIISGTETLTTSLTGKANTTNKLANLLVATYGENTGKALADAGGGSLVGYIGAHVDNKSTNTVSSTLSGKWDLSGEAYLVAAQKDETRLTAKEGHGGVIGVGGTSVENTIVTTTNAKVDKNTEITADRVHVGTGNSVTTGAYDDKDGNGNTDAQTYTLQDHFGGVISGNRLRSLLKVTENGTVTIDEGAKITTNKLQEYIATSNNNLVNNASAKGGGAVGIVDAVSENILTINNTVDVQSGVVLSNEKEASTEGIILSAYDEHNLKAHVEATVGGAVGVLVSKNLTTMDRRSTVNVKGDIESGAKVGLYAGANEDGVLSNLKADLKAGTYNHTAIPVGSPKVRYNKDGDDENAKDIGSDMGMVNVSGTVRSAGDINVTASGGREEIIKDASLFNWVKGGNSTDKTFLSSNAVSEKEMSNQMKKNTVTVTGSLIAGTGEPINVTIGGSVTDGLRYAYTPKEGESYDYNPKNPNAAINRANLKVLKGITEGTFDYANTLGTRLQELNKLISTYGGEGPNTGDASVMASYIAERTRIQDEMIKLGLAETVNGNTEYSSSGRSVYYVEIPDIATSGGNINVQANSLIGTGNLYANSAPSITITNNSDAYLKLNDILMGEQGGSIVYNTDNIIPPGKEMGNEAINKINFQKDAAFSAIYGRETGTQAASLLVKNTLENPTPSTFTPTAEMKEQMKEEVNNDKELTPANKEQLLNEIDNFTSLTYTPITHVEVNGKISNAYGNVTINNASGDIRISGGTQDRPTGVFGTSVTLIAAKGTIAQAYNEGIVNINGDPEKYLKDTATGLQSTARANMQVSTKQIELIPNSGWYITVIDNPNDKFGTATTNYNRTTDYTEATGYIAGRDVYVSAANINVNGLIQSGYKTYSATVTEAQLNLAKTRPAGKAAVIQNRTMYKVNDGGAKWNSTDKVFDYVPQVYWDPSTDKLVVEDIDTQGGKVYLTGMIASTGNGKILAADGAAEISVTNETALDMNVGKVLNNQREGVITIADTAKDTWTEYKRGQTRTITGYADYLKAHAKDGDPYASATPSTNALSVGKIEHGTYVPGTTLEYTLKENQTYTWITGKTVEETAKYHHYVRKGFWGLVKTADTTELTGWSSDSNLLEPKQRKELGLPEGAVIRQPTANTTSDDVPAAGVLRVDAGSRVTSSRIFDEDRYVTRSGFLGWFKHIHDYWKKGTSSIELYNQSLNASQSITIGLIGSETGSINIANTNAKGGSINLTGNVANSHNQATLTVSSAAGSITQFDNTTLKSEIVNLTAKDDIKNIHLASVGTATKDANGNTSLTDNIRLTAVSNNKGDIDITAVGGVLENSSLPGNVTIVALKSRDGNAAFASDAALGDVTLTATGNITQLGNGTTVEGRGINLTSKNGGIGTSGTSGQAINIAGSDLVYSTDRYGAQVNASAKYSIYLTEADAGGDMRVGRIESMEGDVALTIANGGFIDGLQHVDKSGSTESVDEMVHRWIDAGLIDGEKVIQKDAQGNYIKDEQGNYIYEYQKDEQGNYIKDAQGNYIYKYTYKGAYIEGLEKSRDDYASNVRAAYDIETVYASTDYQNYKARTGAYANMTDEQITAKLEEEGHQKYADYAKYETAAEYRTAHQIDWATQYNTEKTVVEAVYASADYKAYVTGTGVYAGLTAEQKSEKLAADGHQNYVTYAKYETADAYMKDTAAYKYSQYADANTYLANDTTYKKLADEAANPTFEWTKEMMLYAVSDKMVNPEGGGSAQTERSANVLGKNITLNATKGAVGTFDDATKTIEVDELNIAKMKELMNVSASDVKVDKDEAGNVLRFHVRQNMPLGVFLKDNGTLTENGTPTSRLDVQAGGDVFVAGRKNGEGDTGINSAINVGSIDATKKEGVTGNVRLHSDEGIYNAKTADDTNIKGNNLILTGGKESIGTAEKPLTVSLSGDMTEARADKNVYVKNMKADAVLRLGAMYAGDTISLNSDKGFLMSDANGNIAESYINAGKSLVFNTNPENGVVGDADHAIRILNNQTPVNITAGSAYVRGVDNSSIQHGTLVLGDITTAGEFTAVGDGSITVKGQKEERDDNNNVVKEAVDIIAGGNVTLDAKDSLTLDGEVKAANNTLTLKAVNGNITQTDKGAITADKVKTFNGHSLLLENEGNIFNSIIVDGVETTAEEKPAIAGDVRIKDNANALTVAVNRNVTGNISVENGGTLTNNGNITATAGSIDIKAGSLLRQTSGTTFKAGKDVMLTSTGNSSQEYSKSIQQYGTIDAGENIILKAFKDVAMTDLTAGQNVTITAEKGDISHVSGKIDAGGKVTMTAKEDVAVTDLTAGENVELTAQTGYINQIGKVNAGGSASLYAGSNVLQQAGALLKAGKDVTMTAASGGIDQNGYAGVQAGNVTIASAKTVDLQGTGNQFDSITVQSSGENTPILGNVLVKDSADKLTLDLKSTVQTGKIDVENTKVQGTLQVVSELHAKGASSSDKGNITLKSKGNLQTDKKIDAENYANITSTNGAVAIDGDVSAGQSITLQSKDTMQTTGTLTAKNDVKLTSTSGDVAINGNVTTGNSKPVNVDLAHGVVQETFNSLTITAGGAIREAAGVTISTPVVVTNSGNGVSMESVNNKFAVFNAEALEGKIAIDGSVKATTNYAGNEIYDFLIGVGADVKGDATFTNLADNGDLDIMILHPNNSDNKEIEVIGGNGADGSLTLTANGNVGLLGDAKVAYDIVINSANGSFDGISRGMKAGHDVSVSVEDSVNYIGGTIDAGNDINMQVKNPTSIDSGIYIGTLAHGRTDTTSLKAGGDVHLDVQGKGDVLITGTIESKNASVSVNTKEGNLVIGTANDATEQTLKAKENITVGTNLGSILVQGEIITQNGDIKVAAASEKYDPNATENNIAFASNGKLTSGRDAYLIATNGDLLVTDDVTANGTFYAQTKGRGDITLGNDLTVMNDLSMSTEIGDITVGKTVTAEQGSVEIQAGTGTVLVGQDITAKENVSITTHKGHVGVGDLTTGEGDVLSKNGNVTIRTDDGTIGIVKTVKADEGSVGITSGKGDILIGSNGSTVKTVTAKQNVNVETDLGTITIQGKTSTDNGDITMKAGKDKYEPGLNTGNFIIEADGEVDSGGAVTLNGRNGDIHITDDIKAVKGINANIKEEGSVYFDRDVTVTNDVNIATDEGNIAVGKTITTTDGSVNLKTGAGEILIGQDITAEKDVSITNKDGDVIVGDLETGDAGHVLSKTGNVSIQADNGIVGIVKSVKAQDGNIDVQVGTGGVIIGNNGPGVETVTAKNNIDIGVELGQIKIYGKTSTETGDISMAAGDNTYTPGVRNFIIEQNGLLESGRDINLTGRNGDLHVTDAIQATRNLNTLVTEGGGVYFDRDADINGDITIAVQNGDVQMHNMNATGNTTIISTGSGSINGNNIVSGGTTHVELTNGDLFLNLAEGKAVVLRMENNTAASRVNTVLADASGAGTDVELTGNYIPIGTIAAKGGNSVLQLSAMGAGNQKLISGEISVGSLRSANGTHMPSLWANRGNIRVDEGNLGMDDVLAVDKIHLENSLTDLAIFGRTPTRDGEQLYYWNNLGRAYSKTRPFDLYTDGKVRTHRAVLVDAGRYYGKLYGDNLSVVDMKREWLTYLHGQFAFDSTQLTSPGQVLRDKVLFGMDAVDTDIRKHNASNRELL